MTYGQRAFALLAGFLALTLGACVFMVIVSGQWASDDLRAGHGSVTFPPQGPPLSQGARP